MAAIPALILAAYACGSTSETTVGPTPPGCQVAVAPTTASVGAAGGTGTVLVTAQPECAWGTSPGPSWILRITPASGQGNGQVEFQASANTGASRTGTFVVAEQTITVTQGNGCTYSVQPTTISADAGGGQISVGVTSGLGCTWTATSQAPWVTLASATGTGNGTAVFSVDANTALPRSGTLTVAERTITVTQATGCTYAISPDSQGFGPAGGNGVVAVTAPVGCPWTAASQASWIEIRVGASGTGPGSVVYTVGPLLLGKRSGSMTIAGHTFTVTQPSQN
jgi:hypothetical protein